MKIEHLVEIKNRAKAKKSKRKWPVDPSDRSKLLARRLDQGLYVNFYDLGQLVTGEEVAFSFNLPTSPLDYTAFDAGHDPPNIPQTFNDYSTDYNTHLLGLGDQDNWHETYRRITPSLIFDASHTGDLGTWIEEKGWKLNRNNPNNALYFFGSRQLHSSVSTDPLHGLGGKITSEPSYSADAVEFVLDKACDLFLIPQLELWDGKAAHWQPSDPPVFPQHYVIKTWYFLNYFVKQRPREFSYSEEFQEWYENDFNPNLPFSSSTSDAMRVAFRNVFISQAESRAFRIDLNGWHSVYGPNVPLPLSLASLSPAAFPDRDSVTWWPPAASPTDPSGDWNRNIQHPPWVRWYRWLQPEGLLMGIIRKRVGTTSNEWYYVWRTTQYTPGFPFHEIDPRLQVTAGGDIGTRV